MTIVRMRYYMLLCAIGAALSAPLAHAVGDQADLTSFGDVISAIYSYSQKLVGLAVFVMFLYAGILMLFGQEGARAKAKEVAKDAVIGLVLLFSAYVILNTINHSFVSQQGSTLPPLK